MESHVDHILIDFHDLQLPFTLPIIEACTSVNQQDVGKLHYKPFEKIYKQENSL